MRMWNVSPKQMCNQHLLGEHVECHMFVGCLNKDMSLKGYLNNGLLEIHNLRKRHDLIAKEMKIRNMKHESELEDFKVVKAGKINSKISHDDLIKRCKDCRSLMWNTQKK